MVIVRDFSGGLNMDVHAPRVPRTDYVDALNITHNAKNKAGSIFHLVGNRVVAFTMPAGTNKCIGAKSDALLNRIIFFNWNSNGNHFIAKFDKEARTITKILEDKTDTNGVAILNFQLDFRINDIDIIHREEDGDLLFFNDAYNRPFGFNIDTIADYIADGVQDYMVHMAKRPPLDVPITEYDSDAAVTVNNFKKKLFQYKYRWKFNDGFKSTWSAVSKVALPVNGYSLDVDADPAENNVMLIQLTAGGVDCKAIEIAMRESNGVTWGDFVLVDSLDIAQYGIEPNSSYTYTFLNDGAYPTLPTEESDLLFDYIPNKANTQAVVNGNRIAYAGITENYDPIPRANINVQVVANLVDTNPNVSPSDLPTISYFVIQDIPTYHSIRFTFGTSVSAGCVFPIAFVTKAPVSVNVSYTAQSGDDIAAVVLALKTDIIAAVPGDWDVVQTGVNEEILTITTNYNAQPVFFTVTNIQATAPAVAQGSTPTWKWNARYRFGLIYFDKFGKTNGVVSYVSTNGDPSDFSVTTPNFVISGSNSNAPQVPQIQASISHLPPSWAVSFQWVRTPNLTVSYFLHHIACQVDDEDDYLYFCVANLDQFRLANTGFVPSYDFLAGDRLRMYDTVDIANVEYTESYHTDDLEIVGVVTRPIPSSSDPDVTDGRFLKVRKPSTIVTTPSPFQLLEIYRPALRSSDEGQVFYEFGEVYSIYEVSDVRYHTGDTQSQTASLPARFTFRDGDVYYKFRTFYSDTLTAGAQFQLGVMDANYSDYWQSAVNSNGRPFVIEPSAKETYNPVLIRFGEAYEQGTDINGLNRFYPLNFIEGIREYGDIKRMLSWNNDLIVAQKLKIGHSPVLQTVIKYINGQDTVVSDRLLNPIQYFKGQYGLGDYANSLVATENAIYFWDSLRKANCRLSQSGIDPISKQNNANAYAVSNCLNRNVHGVYDSENDVYISFFDLMDGSAASTIVWNERRKSYESKISLTADIACEINGLVCTWINGVMYTLDDEANLNTFYGVTYESYITPIFNDEAATKKVFNNLTLLSGEAWEIQSMESNVRSYMQTLQASYIKEASFVYSEGEYHAAIPPDTNSAGGRANGAAMKGQWLKAKIRKETPTAYSYLSAIILNNEKSPKNP